jgi:AcrR family transcriptional regulator
MFIPGRTLEPGTSRSLAEEEPPTMTERPHDKKAAVFAAALALIAEQGFTGAPMSQIAERAEVGVGTIYRYFAGKDDLVNALYLDIKARLAAHTLRGYADSMPVRPTGGLGRRAPDWQLPGVCRPD